MSSCENKTGNGNLDTQKFFTETQNMIRELRKKRMSRIDVIGQNGNTGDHYDKPRTLLHNSLRTPDGTVMVSHHRHDYQTYTDANGREYMIDGGLDYLRRNVREDQEDLSVYTDDSHELIRGRVTWGTYGKGGDQPLEYKLLKDLSDGHIAAILETQVQIRQGLKGVMLDEQAYRRNQLVECEAVSCAKVEEDG